MPFQKEGLVIKIFRVNLLSNILPFGKAWLGFYAFTLKIAFLNSGTYEMQGA